MTESGRRRLRLPRPPRDPDAPAYLRLVGLGGVIGLPAALLAALFLIVAIVVGVVAAVIVAAVRLGAGELSKEGPRRVGLPVLLVGGGLAVGLVAQVADWLGADSQDVLFSGQTGVPGLASASTQVLVVLLVAKAIG